VDYFFILLIGLTAGVIGGLAGIGGSMIIIPGCALALGYDDAAHTRLHVFMAAALCVNVAVAVPATLKHYRAKLIRRDLVLKILPAMALAMIAGVLSANAIPGRILKLMLAAFILIYCGFTLYRLFQASTPRIEANGGSLPTRTGVLIGTLAGLVGGMLGLGGGVVMVPLMQVVGRIKLREAVATSSAVMCITASIGSATKLSTLANVGRSISEALSLAGLLLPGAVAGSMVGASMVQTLPLKWIRGLIAGILALIAARMAWSV
jgi:uncharacterized protein